MAGPGRVVTEQAGRPGLVDRVLQALGGQRVLTPDVDPAVLGPGGEPGEGERLDDRERVVLHHHPVLERAGFRLVAVGHHVLGTTLFGGHRPPFHTGGEGGAAPAGQTGVGHRGAHRLGPQLDRPLEGGVATVIPVGVERGGVGHTDPGEKPQRRIALLRDHPPGAVTGGTAVGRYVIRLPDPLHEPRRRAFALAEARRPVHVSARGLDLGGELVGPADLAGRVDADVHGRSPVVGLLDPEHLVERRHPVGLGGGHLEHVAHVVEPARADPSLRVVEGVKGREQQVAAVVAAGHPAPHQPFRLVDHGRVVADRGGDRGDLGLVGQIRADEEVSHPAARSGWRPP